jgi:hypothetical protein
LAAIKKISNKISHGMAEFVFQSDDSVTNIECVNIAREYDKVIRGYKKLEGLNYQAYRSPLFLNLFSP